MCKSFLSSVWLLAVSLGICTTFSEAQMATPRLGTGTKPAVVQKDVPAEFQAAIAQMISAKGDLEKAGDKWGGHRVKAIGIIDQALRAVGQPPVASRNEMKSGNTDEPALMNSGISKLNTAKSEFEKSGNQWGGRRAKAVSLIDEALKELQVGIEYAKSHHTY